MPTFELEESDFAGYIPDDEVKTATVVSVKLAEQNFVDDDGKKVMKVEFKFKIIDGSVHDGTDIWGKTPTRFNTHPDCKLRNWAQAILGQSLPPKFRLDTDVLVGRDCRLIIGLREYEKDGQTKQTNYVKDVMPTADAMASMAAAVRSEEPF